MVVKFFRLYVAVRYLTMFVCLFLLSGFILSGLLSVTNAFSGHIYLFWNNLNLLESYESAFACTCIYGGKS